MIKVSNAYKLDWNVAELVRMVDDGEVDFNAPIQRGYVWDNKRNSLLIQSILIGWPISVFYFNRVDGKIYEGLEGKQRSNAICEYVKGNYKLHTKTPPVFDKDGKMVNIARYTFNQLSEYLQNRILRYGLIIQSFDDMSIDEKVDFFTRINSGKPVTPAELARIKVKSRNIFLSLAEHPAIVIGVSETNKRKCFDEDVVEQIWYICYNENPSLLSKDTAPVLASTDVTKVQEQELRASLDYLALLLKEVAQTNKKMFRKMRAKTHIVSLGYMAYVAISNKISAEEYVKRAKAFFNAEGRSATISKSYNAATSSATAKSDQVRIRMNEVKKALIKG